MESFHLANRNLTLGLYSDGIFMAVLETLVGDGACRRLSQEKKEMLETRMDGLPYSDNMSPEKIKMLESIRRELKQGSDWRQWDARSSSSAYSRGGQNLNDEDRVVLGFAEDIMAAAAGHHNREEVQRVAQLAQQVLYLLPHLRYLQLTRHPETTKHRHELDAALQTIRQSSSSRAAARCAPPAMISTSFRRNEGKRITQHGNWIEESYQKLTFAAMAQIANKLASGNNDA
ncbi:hypothetical protein BS78_08G102700 [Paspalum vaginatum]|nr:hypothetical protein BS78_08G102700 [Paspalum vaginatum]